MNQTYDKWELIVVDDGSDDATPKVVCDISDPRIHFLRKEHEGIMGLGASYNLALNQARGELTAILEGDDCWPPTKLETEVPLFEPRGVTLSWGRGQTIDAEGRTLGWLEMQDHGQPVTRWHARDLLPIILLNNIIRPSSGVMIDTEALRAIGGFKQPKGIPYVDLPTWIELASHMNADDVFVYHRNLATYWRLHGRQFSRHYADMIRSRAAIILGFVEESDQEKLADLGLGQTYVSSLVTMSLARVALAAKEWEEAAVHIRNGWDQADAMMKIRLILAGLSCALRTDLFRLPFALQQKLPEAVNRSANVAMAIEFRRRLPRSRKEVPRTM